MTAQIVAYGRLGQAPRQIATRTGTPIAVGSIACDISEDADGPPLWLGVVAFGNTADALLRHGKGDLLSVSGRLQRRTWTDSEGATREQLQCIADAIVSARTVRLGGGRKRGKRSEQLEGFAP